MASISGANIVDNGLIFHMDMDNRVNSWINPPGKNQFGYSTDNGYLTVSSPEKANMNSSSSDAGWGHWGSTGISGTYGTNTDPQFIWDKSLDRSHYHTCNPESTVNYLMYRVLPFEGQQFGSVVAGWGGGNPNSKERSFRYIMKRSDGGVVDETIVGLAANNVIHYHPYGDGVNYPTRYSTLGTISPWSEINYLGDGWYELIANHLLQGGNNDLIGFFLSPGYTVYVGFAQMEETGVISRRPFIGERSNTEAIVDITKNNDITIHNLSYNSDGSFEFDGTDDYLSTFKNNEHFVENQSWTISAFVNVFTSANGRGGILCNQRYFTEPNPGGFGLAINYGKYVGMLTHDDGAGTTSSYQSLSPLSINYNVVEMITYVYNSSEQTMYAYRNGILENYSTNVLYKWSPGGLFNSKIGSNTQGGWGYFFNMKIHDLKVYNRALSVNEVQGNFEALRGRFDL